MTKRTASAKRARGAPHAAASVLLPGELRAQVEAEARRRGLKLSPAVRVLLSERIQQIGDADQLSRAEEWQRAEAWATWERMKAGDHSEVGKEQLDADFDAALERAHARQSA